MFAVDYQYFNCSLSGLDVNLFSDFQPGENGDLCLLRISKEDNEPFDIDSNYYSDYSIASKLTNPLYNGSTFRSLYFCYFCSLIET